jgi:hypothetical protein
VRSRVAGKPMRRPISPASAAASGMPRRTARRAGSAAAAVVLPGPLTMPRGAQPGAQDIAFTENGALPWKSILEANAGLDPDRTRWSEIRSTNSPIAVRMNVVCCHAVAVCTSSARRASDGVDSPASIRRIIAVTAACVGVGTPYARPRSATYPLK